MYYLLKWIKFSVKKQNIKNTGKMEKDTGKVREFCQSGKVETMPGGSASRRREGLPPGSLHPGWAKKHGILRDTVNKWAVHILLECILVN